EIGPLAIQTHISLIVHVRELKLTSNTAQFVEKLLPHQSQIFIRGRVHDEFQSGPVLARSGRPLFLYPHDDAFELPERLISAHPDPYDLIVPDGNWHQARRARKREDAFRSIMAVKLPPGITTEYVLRRSPAPHWVSTFEATAWALGLLE